MPPINVVFINAFDSENPPNADVLIVWSPPTKQPRGFTTIAEGTPQVLMNNVLEMLRQTPAETEFDPASFVVRNPSHEDVNVGLLLWKHGGPEKLPKTETTELQQDGVSVNARVHIFPMTSLRDCEVAVQSTPRSQWQTHTDSERNYKHVRITPAAAVEDSWCTIC